MDAKFVSVYINQLGAFFRAGFGTPEDLAAGRLTPDAAGLAAYADAVAAEDLRLNPPPPPEPEPEPEAGIDLADGPDATAMIVIEPEDVQEG